VLSLGPRPAAPRPLQFPSLRILLGVWAPRGARVCHLFRALALIWGRLDRCSQASFFAHDTHFVWGELYDLRPHELEGLLDRADELAATRAMLWSGAGLAAKLRGDSDAIALTKPVRRSPVKTHMAPRSPLRSSS